MLRTHLLRCFFCGKEITRKPYNTVLGMLSGEGFCSEECLLNTLRGIHPRLRRIELDNFMRSERPRDPLNLRNTTLWEAIHRKKTLKKGVRAQNKKK